MTKSVKFWQIGTQSTDPLEADLDSTSTTSATIKSITLYAKGSIAVISDADGMVKTWDTSTGLCKTSFQTPAKGSDSTDSQLINGRLILVWDIDAKITIWDVEKEKELFVVGGLEKSTYRALKISGDGSRVFFLSAGLMHAYSIETGEVVNKIRPMGSVRATLPQRSRCTILRLPKAS